MYRLLLISLLVIVVGSCKPDVAGCTDPKADNYNAFATVEDSTCLYDGKTPGEIIEEAVPVFGCTDTAADNYNPDATDDDGSCEYLGCTDPEADNYDPNANVDDGSCIDKREKFKGDWAVTSDCGILALSDPQNISYNENNKDTIWFKPFTAFGDGYGIVTGFDVEIPSQSFQLGGFITIDIDGDGSINSAKDEINIDINYDAGFVGSGSCTATYTK